MSTRTASLLLERAGWVLLCAFVFSMPWEKSVWVPGVGTISRFLGLLAFGALAAAAIARREFRPPNLALLLAAGFVSWTGLTYFWSVAPPASSLRFVTFLQLLAMAWVIWEFCRTPGRQAGLMQFYVWGAAVAAAGTLARYIEGEQTYYRRYAAAGFDPNDLALTVVLSIPLALYLALRQGGWVAWACRLTVAIVIAALLLTASRTALIAGLLAFGFLFWTWRRSELTQKVSGAVLLLLLVLGAVWLAPSASRQRLATLPQELAEGTLHNRTRIWKAGLRAVKERPLVGVGAGAYPEAVRPALGRPALAGHEYVAHNAFLSVLVETGLAGFALWGLLLLTLAIFVWVMPGAERALWSVTLAVWVLGVSTLTWEHRKPTWFLFALIMTAWARSFWPSDKRA